MAVRDRVSIRLIQLESRRIPFKLDTHLISAQVASARQQTGPICPKSVKFLQRGSTVLRGKSHADPIVDRP